MSWTLAEDQSKGNPTGPPLKTLLQDKVAPLNTLHDCLCPIGILAVPLISPAPSPGSVRSP